MSVLADLTSIRVTEQGTGLETEVAVAAIRCLYAAGRGTRIQLRHQRDLVVRENRTTILRLIKAAR